MTHRMIFRYETTAEPGQKPHAIGGRYPSLKAVLTKAAPTRTTDKAISTRKENNEPWSINQNLDSKEKRKPTEALGGNYTRQGQFSKARSRKGRNGVLFRKGLNAVWGGTPQLAAEGANVIPFQTKETGITTALRASPPEGNCRGEKTETLTSRRPVRILGRGRLCKRRAGRGVGNMRLV